MMVEDADFILQSQPSVHRFASAQVRPLSFPGWRPQVFFVLSEGQLPLVMTSHHHRWNLKVEPILGHRQRERQ